MRSEDISFFQKFAVLKQVALFLLIGVISTVGNYSVYLFAFRVLHIHYLASSFIGYVSGVLISFPFNRRYTFSSKNSTPSLLLKYFCVYACTLALGLVVLHCTVKFVHISPEYAQIISLIVTTITNFLACKYAVFTKPLNIAAGDNVRNPYSQYTQHDREE